MESHVNAFKEHNPNLDSRKHILAAFQRPDYTLINVKAGQEFRFYCAHCFTGMNSRGQCRMEYIQIIYAESAVPLLHRLCSVPIAM